MAVDHFEHDPIRRNLMVTCLIFLVYIFGKGQLVEVDESSAVRLGWVGVELHNPIVIQVAAVLILLWNWYRYECFGDKTQWHKVDQELSRMLWFDKVARVVVWEFFSGRKATDRDKESLKKNSMKAPGAVHHLNFGAHLSFLGEKLGPLWDAITGSWKLINNSDRGVGNPKYIKWDSSWFLRMRLLVQALYRTEFIPSIILPRSLLLATFLALLAPCWAGFYTAYGVPTTVTGSLILLLLFYWRDIGEIAVHYWSLYDSAKERVPAQ